MKLSIVIICWNDLKVIHNCLQSIFNETSFVEYEVIVSDNGSTDDSIEHIRTHFPQVHLIENGANLGFAKGNNVGIRASQGDYVLILNPDTIIHEGALDKWVRFAEKHPEAGAFGCKVMNPDGSFQNCARPFPTIRSQLIAALYLRPLAYLGDYFDSDLYYCWHGNSERLIDWQSGCCVMFRRALLEKLNGFDEQFFYHKEEVDLCRRVWNSGYKIIYTPEASITHLGGQSVNRFPIRFELETYRSTYRYFFKHFGTRGARRIRLINLASILFKSLGYGALSIIKPSEALKNRLHMYRVSFIWNLHLDPESFVLNGTEPEAE